MSCHSRVLLTGGAGFVGSQIVNALLKDGSEVVVFDNLSTGRLDNLTWEKQLTGVGELSVEVF